MVQWKEYESVADPSISLTCFQILKVWVYYFWGRLNKKIEFKNSTQSFDVKRVERKGNKWIHVYWWHPAGALIVMTLGKEVN